MSTELVKIEPASIPPLHQSTESLTSCPKFYVEAIIKRRRQPGGVESARGNQVHKAGAAIAAWCAHKGVAMDLEAFDRFAAGAGPAAAKILVGMRESYSVDFAHLLATEVPMSLDEHFQPTDVADSIESESGDSGLPATYSGILDTLYLIREECEIDIDDLKTHPRPYDPSESDKALQGKMYSLFAFQHFKWAEKVKFRLIFVRYKNLVREVTYTRADVPMLIESVKAARSRQLMIHEDYETGRPIEAMSGAQCIYCPLLSNRGCPISEFNPQMQLTPSDRLRFNLWYSAFSKVNNKTLREYVQGTGRNVITKDYNGKAYSFGPVPGESLVFPLFHKTERGIATKCRSCYATFEYVPKDGRCPKCAQGVVAPIMPIVELIESYAHGNPEDTEWMGQLLISSTKLNSALGTKKRAFLDQSCQDSADHVSKAPLKVSKPLDAVPDEEPEGDEPIWDDDEEF